METATPPATLKPRSILYHLFHRPRLMGDQRVQMNSLKNELELTRVKTSAWTWLDALIGAGGWESLSMKDVVQLIGFRVGIKRPEPGITTEEFFAQMEAVHGLIGPRRMKFLMAYDHIPRKNGNWMSEEELMAYERSDPEEMHHKKTKFFILKQGLLAEPKLKKIQFHDEYGEVIIDPSDDPPRLPVPLLIAAAAIAVLVAMIIFR